MPEAEDTAIVQAHVVLKGPAGGVLGADKVSSQSVGQYVAPPEVRERVRSRLEALGFEVRRVGPLSLSVSATAATYRRAFGRSVRRVEHESGGGAQAASWRWEAPPVIPADLSDVVEGIVLPQPIRAAP